jgi:hypothetical protein
MKGFIMNKQLFFALSFLTILNINAMVEAEIAEANTQLAQLQQKFIA